MGAGQQIQDKDKNVIGIHVSAKTIKNKVSAPFRICNFEIHFGVGIKEHEQIFDVLRKHGKEIIGNEEISVSGTGTWKVLTVRNVKTDDLVFEKKFFKTGFNEILRDPEYSPYLDSLLDRAMIKKIKNSTDMIVDPESYEEVRAISLELEDSLADPEA